MKDGSHNLGDYIVWYQGGLIHREDGPAVEFKDGRKLWVLNGQLVAEQEVGVRRGEEDRQVRQQSDALLEQRQADELSQYQTGLAKSITVRSKPLFRK